MTDTHNNKTGKDRLVDHIARRLNEDRATTEEIARDERVAFETAFEDDVQQVDGTFIIDYRPN